jgi:hypothetical protein
MVRGYTERDNGKGFGGSDFACRTPRMVKGWDEEQLMTLSVDLTPDLELRLQRAAARHGLESSDYVRRLLEDQLPPVDERPLALWETLTPGEWKQEFHAWLDSHDPQQPPLPPEAFERASFYGQRG